MKSLNPNASVFDPEVGSNRDIRSQAQTGQDGRAEITKTAIALETQGSWQPIPNSQEAADRYGDAAGEMTVCKIIEEDADVNLRVKGNWLAPWEVKHASEK